MMTKGLLKTITVGMLFLVPGTALADKAERDDERSCNVSTENESVYVDDEGYAHRVLVNNRCDMRVECSAFEHSTFKGAPYEAGAEPDAKFMIEAGESKTVLISAGNERSGFDVTVSCAAAE